MQNWTVRKLKSGKYAVVWSGRNILLTNQYGDYDDKLRAYLASAAPELYEALNNLVELATKQLDQSATNEGMENCDCLASARAALAKAEGR